MNDRSIGRGEMNEVEFQKNEPTREQNHSFIANMKLLYSRIIKFNIFILEFLNIISRCMYIH